jgi:hypothetical protein
LSLHTEFLLLFENAALLREVVTWGRESSRQVQDLPQVKISLIRAGFSNSRRNGMKNLKERANKCTDQGGMYFEE